jgi:hypothetical protein
MPNDGCTSDPAPDQLLPGDPEVHRDQHDVRREHPEGQLGRSFDDAGIEVLVGEQTTDILDDLGSALLHASERVDPVGGVAVDADQRVRVAVHESRPQRFERAHDGFLIANGKRGQRRLGSARGDAPIQAAVAAAPGRGNRRAT